MQFDPVGDKKWGWPSAPAGNVLWIVPLPALSRTLLPLQISVTISFTPVGPPPALVRSVIKCHWLHTHTSSSEWMRRGRRRYYGSIFITRRNDVSQVGARSWCYLGLRLICSQLPDKFCLEKKRQCKWACCRTTVSLLQKRGFQIRRPKLVSHLNYRKTTTVMHGCKTGTSQWTHKHSTVAFGALWVDREVARSLAQTEDALLIRVTLAPSCSWFWCCWTQKATHGSGGHSKYAVTFSV